jgi:hypothetical protein
VTLFAFHSPLACSIAFAPRLSSLPLSFSPFFLCHSLLSRTSHTYIHIHVHKSHVLLPPHCIRNGSQEPRKERRLRRVAGARNSRRRCDGRSKFSALAPALAGRKKGGRAGGGGGGGGQRKAMRIKSWVAGLVLSNETLPIGQGQ